MEKRKNKNVHGKKCIKNIKKEKKKDDLRTMVTPKLHFLRSEKIPDYSSK
jgi:hypothetical protein